MTAIANSRGGCLLVDKIVPAKAISDDSDWEEGTWAYRDKR